MIAGGDPAPSIPLAAYLFLAPLLVTLVVEVPIVAVAGGFRRRAWAVGILANTLTNPIAVLAYMGRLAMPWSLLGVATPGVFVSLCGIEAAVVVVEAGIFRCALDWTRRRALCVSLLANGLTAVLSVLGESFWLVS